MNGLRIFWLAIIKPVALKRANNFNHEIHNYNYLHKMEENRKVFGTFLLPIISLYLVILITFYDVFDENNTILSVCLITLFIVFTYLIAQVFEASSDKYESSLFYMEKIVKYDRLIVAVIKNDKSTIYEVDYLKLLSFSDLVLKLESLNLSDFYKEEINFIKLEEPVYGKKP